MGAVECFVDIVVFFIAKALSLLQLKIVLVPDDGEIKQQPHHHVILVGLVFEAGK